MFFIDHTNLIVMTQLHVDKFLLVSNGNKLQAPHLRTYNARYKHLGIQQKCITTHSVKAKLMVPETQFHSWHAKLQLLPFLFSVVSVCNVTPPQKCHDSIYQNYHSYIYVAANITSNN